MLIYYSWYKNTITGMCTSYDFYFNIKFKQSDNFHPRPIAFILKFVISITIAPTFNFKS